ncbi:MULTISPECIES: tyrosine-protein phosphatase [Nocardia]|uniref:tyrosine-protein phosphatase n=1 Tax=Nocardia TaxID=1817 RepID=UPI001E4082EE|nr:MULTISPECIES: tyrosine-protein phosphatase [Nocardia]UEX23158.1 tyrosine-protein phosphatase [Nocardia farcinica]
MKFPHVARGVVAVSAVALVGVLPTLTAPAQAGPLAPMLEAPGRDQRPLGLAHAPNARDIGGYPVRGGGKVRFGVVYRADALAKLDGAEQQRLVDLGVQQVIDFRSPTEVAQAPDKLPAAIRRTEYPVYDANNDLYVLMSRLIAGGPQAQREALGDGKGVRYMSDYYRWLVTDASARGQFAAALRDVAGAPGAVLYHCTAGKDRTGWMTAILFSVLGVPDGQIYQDFLASNANLAAGNKALLDNLVAQGLVEDPELWEPILGVQREFLDAAFDQVRRSYGSMDEFLTAGLGLDTATLDALRSALVG